MRRRLAPDAVFLRSAKQFGQAPPVFRRQDRQPPRQVRQAGFFALRAVTGARAADWLRVTPPWIAVYMTPASVGLTDAEVQRLSARRWLRLVVREPSARVCGRTSRGPLTIY